MMNRDEFGLLINTMEFPVMTEEDFDINNGLISSTIVVRDREDCKNHFCCPTIRLMRREYDRSELFGYNRRRREAMLKYERWMHHFFGNNCVSELSVPEFE